MKKTDYSRRDFIKTTAVGIGVATLAGLGAKEAKAEEPPQKWDEETDVVVVGFGGAGAAAAVTARDAGADVIVLEKMASMGGTTIISAGQVYAGGTSVQSSQGIADSADAMYSYYMKAARGFNDPELCRMAVYSSADNIEWLMKLGVEYPQGSVGYSTAEKAFGITPVPRTHNPKAKGGKIAGGVALMTVMKEAVENRGGKIRLNTAAVALVATQGKEVLGVKAVSDGKEMYIKARKGVILTTGGFARDKELLRKYTSKGYKSKPLSGLGCTGDGLKMALPLAADVFNIHEIFGVDTVPVEGEGLYLGIVATPFSRPMILVNKSGLRFHDETVYYEWTNEALLRQVDGTGYIIFDEVVRQQGMAGVMFGFSNDLSAEIKDGRVLAASSLLDLATKIGVPTERFLNTVDMWNEDVGWGRDREYGRTDFLGPISTPPFYSAEVHPGMLDTTGGLKINTKAQVVDVLGNIIPRLYAAGMVAGGPTGEIYPGGGTAINICMTFGRVAGNNAAAEASQ
jgi:flavocytochrome c